MASRVVIDTNVAIYLTRNNDRSRRYRSIIEGKVLAISFITVAELDLTGRKSANPKATKQFWKEKMAQLAILWPDEETCRIWAEITSNLKAGIARQDNDLWIAASAIRYDLPLVSHNSKDFSGIPKLNLLTLPDPKNAT